MRVFALRRGRKLLIPLINDAKKIHLSPKILYQILWIACGEIIRKICAIKIFSSSSKKT
jgi:hypothetical protein